MKKITLLIILLMFAGSMNAQILNQPANWPNATWTITGVFNTDPLAFEADPTLTANFAFDDDDAGNPSDDDIAGESPVIDLTAAIAGSQPYIFVTVDYSYNLLADTLSLEYWDDDAAAWTLWELLAETDPDIQDFFCTGVKGSYLSPPLDASGFSAAQLSNFQYRFSFLDDGGAGGGAWEWGFCFDSPTIKSSPTLSVTELDNSTAFSYYPNPVENVLTINAQNEISNVVVYNMLGQEVLKSTPNALNSTIDMSGFNSGAYFVNITINNKVEMIKVIRK